MSQDREHQARVYLGALLRIIWELENNPPPLSAQGSGSTCERIYTLAQEAVGEEEYP